MSLLLLLLFEAFFVCVFYFLSLYQCGWSRCRHRFHCMNTEGVTDLTDIQCRQARPLQLIKSSESCHEILYIEHILLAFFWLDWSKGAAFYSSVTEDAILGCIFGLQLWLSEGGQHFWKVKKNSYILGLLFFYFFLFIFFHCWLFGFSLTSLRGWLGLGIG